MCFNVSKALVGHFVVLPVLKYFCTILWCAFIPIGSASAVGEPKQKSNMIKFTQAHSPQGKTHTCHHNTVYFTIFAAVCYIMASHALTKIS